jgi:hypothetical protein
MGQFRASPMPSLLSSSAALAGIVALAFMLKSFNTSATPVCYLPSYL